MVPGLDVTDTILGSMCFCDHQFTLGGDGLCHLKGIFLHRQVGSLSCLLLWSIKLLTAGATWLQATCDPARSVHQAPIPFRLGDPLFCCHLRLNLSGIPHNKLCLILELSPLSLVSWSSAFGGWFQYTSGNFPKLSRERTQLSWAQTRDPKKL